MDIVGEPIVCYPVTLKDYVRDERKTITVSEKELADLYISLEKIVRVDDRFRELVRKKI